MTQKYKKKKKKKKKMMTMEDSTLRMMRAGAFETMKQRIRECLKDPNIYRFAFHGWEGVGRSMFLRHAIDEFTLQAQHEYEEEGIRDNLYEIVWVTRPHSVSDLRAGMLKVVENEEYTGASYTYGFPFLNRKTMLILDEVQEPNIFDDMGDSVWEHVALPGSKIVVTSPNKEIWRAMEIDVSINGKWEDLSEEEAWVLLWEEVKDVSNSLTTLNNIETDSYNVMLCYCYSVLFPDLFCNCALYWRSEGLIGAYENWKKMFSYYSPLLHMLHDRAMLHYSERGMVKWVKVYDSIKSKVVPVLERKGFLVRCNLELEEISVVEWEQENLKRISLAGNHLTTLSRPPKFPQLLTLILSENPLLHELPDDFFQNMQGLRVLDMSCTAITSLPSSMSSLTNLRLLALQDCLGLNTLSLPLLHALQKLEVLLLEGSPLPGLREFSLHMMESIYYIEIDGASNLTQLSVKGCCSLEYLNPPKNLEMLDLSSTKIGDFNDFSFSQLECLRHLDLLDTKHLKFVPWHDIDRLPQTLNWDQCSHRSPTKEQFDNHQGYCISVSDHKIFHLLSRDSGLWEKYFKKFRFSVASCDDHPRQRNQPKDADNPFRRTHFIYSRIYAAAKTTHFTEFIRSYDRCLEIGSTNDVPRGIHGVLYNTEFLSLCENNSITRLSHLGVENIDNLIECKIERCQNMQSLINIDRTTRTVVAFIRLEILLVFDLTNLKSLCRGTLGQGSFARLKHIYLEHCPRLFSLFSSSVRFENLETLEIKFCDNLERLFEEDNVEGQDVFPQLKELYLLKLRKLKCICNGKLPALEKLKAHGCPLLQKLPLPIATGNKLNTVVIGGHQEWKRDLKWEEQLINQRVKLNVPRAFKI